MIETSNREKTLRPRRIQTLLLAVATVGAFAGSPAFAANNATSDTNARATDSPGDTATQDQSSRYNLSKANSLLFDTNHLANVDAPAELKYTFVRSGDSDNNYDDHVDLKIKNGSNDTKSVAVDFLSGDRHRFVPEVDFARGNPAIMMFLQNDVIEMAHRTGGNWRYFQRQIKTALEDSAQVQTQTAEFDGESVETTQVVIRPYARDQAHEDDIGGELDKRYVFTLSEAVPGQVLEIRSEVPAGKSGNEPIIERLNLEAVKTQDDDSNAAHSKASA